MPVVKACANSQSNMNSANKTILRRQHKQLRSQMQNRAEKDSAICYNLRQLPAWQKAGRVLCYVSSSLEVSTRKIIAAAWQQGKEVYAPLCTDKQGHMAFYRIASEKDLSPGNYNILEPVEGLPPLLKSFSQDLCVVPALSYDEQFYRLGFGKGYYDRFLAGFNGIKVGICYEENIQPQLPHSHFDIPVDFIVTQSLLRQRAVK